MLSAPASDNALHIESIAALLPPGTRRWFDLRVVESTGSTNTDLLDHAAHLPSGSVLAAEHQTAGRGRRGRKWVAPPGGSLAFSVLWKFQGGASALSGLSLAVGVAVAQALEQCGATAIGLKWPNDLLAKRHDRWAKLGGILIELAGAQALGRETDAGQAARSPDTSNQVSAIIGIGLNVNLGAAAADIDQAVTDLRSIGCGVTRNALLAAILHQLGETLPAFAIGGFAPFAAHWNERHAWRGQHVQLMEAGPVEADRVVVGNGTDAGIALGVDGDGALLIETQGGVRRVISGDLSLREAGLSQS